MRLSCPFEAAYPCVSLTNTDTWAGRPLVDLDIRLHAARAEFTDEVEEQSVFGFAGGSHTMGMPQLCEGFPRVPRQICARGA